MSVAQPWAGVAPWLSGLRYRWRPSTAGRWSGGRRHRGGSRSALAAAYLHPLQGVAARGLVAQKGHEADYGPGGGYYGAAHSGAPLLQLERFRMDMAPPDARVPAAMRRPFP